MLRTFVSYLEHHNLSSYLTSFISVSSTTYPFYSSQMNLISISFVLCSAPAEFFFPSFIVPVARNNHSYPFSHSKLMYTVSSPLIHSVVNRSGSRYKIPLINILPGPKDPQICLFKYNKQRKQCFCMFVIN